MSDDIEAAHRKALHLVAGHPDAIWLRRNVMTE